VLHLVGQLLICNTMYTCHKEKHRSFRRC